MNIRSLATFAVGLLLGSGAALATPVQSTTTTLLTLRNCIAGTTACDGISTTIASAIDGLPADSSSSASLTDSAFGAALSGSTQITSPGSSLLTGSATSAAGKRNSTNQGSLQRFTYMGGTPATLTFWASIAYNQTVPTENANFDPNNAAAVFSGVSGGIEVFTIDDAEIEAGATERTNFNTIFGGYTNAPGYTTLGSASSASSNLTGSGSNNLSVSFNVNSGQSVWLMARMQTPAVNGASVSATMVTGIPAPGTLALAALGLAVIGFSRSRRV